MDGWDTESLSDAGQAEFYKAVQERQTATERDRRHVNRLGYIVGTGGVAGSMIILACALALFWKIPPQQQPTYVLVDRTSGSIVPAASAKDAPMLFPEATRRAEIKALIDACEGYVQETWAKINFHQCMIRLTPDEQKRRTLDIGLNGTRYPPKIFGPAGWAMPSEFPLGGFVLMDTTGSPPNEIFHYAVRYERTEVINNVEQRVRWSADIRFSFRPDLKISPADALANPARMQVASYSTIRDR